MREKRGREEACILKHLGEDPGHSESSEGRVESARSAELSCSRFEAPLRSAEPEALFQCLGC